MLVLGRREGEQIIINDDLILTITYLKRGMVKISFDGDIDKYIIDRKEIYDLKKLERE